MGLDDSIRASYDDIAHALFLPKLDHEFSNFLTARFKGWAVRICRTTGYLSLLSLGVNEATSGNWLGRYELLTMGHSGMHLCFRCLLQWLMWFYEIPMLFRSDVSGRRMVIKDIQDLSKLNVKWKVHKIISWKWRSVISKHDDNDRPSNKLSPCSFSLGLTRGSSVYFYGRLCRSNCVGGCVLRLIAIFYY